jgi:hypothetical protein
LADRFWTHQEADRALDRVGGVVERARAAMDELRAKAEQASSHAGGNGHAKKGTEREIFMAAVDELAADGIILRDIDRGLVDFPARSASGRPYWLCWVVGEPRVDWWHWPEDGFAGRTPIEQLPD